MSILSEESALQEYHRAMDEQRIADDAQDAAMVQRWEDFIAWCREQHTDALVGWGGLIQLAGEVATDPPKYDGRLKTVIREYIDSDGLAMCLRAIAQAMDAEAIDRAETERRR